MISSRFQIAFIAFMLAATGLFIVWYKVVYLGVPLMPVEKRSIFTVTAEIDLKGDGGPIDVVLRLPQERPGMRILSQEGDAGTFGMTTSTLDGAEYVQWSRRTLEGRNKRFYKLTVMPESHYAPKAAAAQADAAEKPVEDDLIYWEESERSAAETILAYARERSSGPVSMTAQIIAMFNAEQLSDAVKGLGEKKNETKISLITALLRHEGIAFTKVRGIMLEDGQKHRKLTTYLEVTQQDGDPAYFSFKNGRISLPRQFFIWYKGNGPLLSTKGADKARLRFSVSESKVSADSLNQSEAQKVRNDFMNFSLFTLPGSQQNAFKQLLLVPIGALMVVIFRILIGVRTMGTFMPVLIALAFIQTTLLSGLMMFVVILGAGLMVRGYLSRLQLLLVARISAVIIVVITLMSVMSIVSYKLGIDDVLKITFFPMIILSWTIERMSVLWEEEGGREALRQISGSLVVAVAAYFAMDTALVKYLTFTFPELLLVILAVIILIGRYTGYRLSELLRFAPMVRQ